MKTIICDNIYLSGVGFKSGTLKIDGSKIISVNQKISKKYDMDCRGKYIYPGLIDPHSHIGVDEIESGLDMGDTNEYSSPNNAHLRISDAVFPRDPAFLDALKSGITSVGVLPGSANPIGGLGVALHTSGRVVEEMTIKEPVGLKMASGENIRRVSKMTKKGPSTRMGNIALMRTIFNNTLIYMKKKKKDRNLNSEAIEKLLKREIPARIHAHRDDDIMAVIRVAEEFGFDYVIDHASSSHRIMDILAEKNSKLVIGPTTSVRRKIETKDKTFLTAVEAEKYNMLFSITCDHPVVSIDLLPVMGSLLMKNGLKEVSTMDALTINGAKILGIDDKTGSLEKNKMADFVISTAHPMDIANNVVEEVYICGKRVYKK